MLESQAASQQGGRWPGHTTPVSPQPAPDDVARVTSLPFCPSDSHPPNLGYGFFQMHKGPFLAAGLRPLYFPIGESIPFYWARASTGGTTPGGLRAGQLPGWQVALSLCWACTASLTFHSLSWDISAEQLSTLALSLRHEEDRPRLETHLPGEWRCP